MCVHMCLTACVCVCVCVRACVRGCVRACVRLCAIVCDCVRLYENYIVTIHYTSDDISLAVSDDEEINGLSYVEMNRNR